VIPALNLARFGAGDGGFDAGVFQRLLGIDQFGLLEAVCRQDEDLPVVPLGSRCC
jgi:hypothetical protein